MILNPTRSTGVQEVAAPSLKSWRFVDQERSASPNQCPMALSVAQAPATAQATTRSAPIHFRVSVNWKGTPFTNALRREPQSWSSDVMPRRSVSPPLVDRSVSYLIVNAQETEPCAARFSPRLAGSRRRLFSAVSRARIPSSEKTVTHWPARIPGYSLPRQWPFLSCWLCRINVLICALVKERT